MISANFLDELTIFQDSRARDITFFFVYFRCMVQVVDVTNFMILAIEIPLAGCVCNSLFVLNKVSVSK